MYTKIFKCVLIAITILSVLLLSGCDSTIIKTLLPPPKVNVSSDINANKNISLEVSDANGKPLRNAWYKSYCTNEAGFVTFPYSSLNGENSIELRVYNENGESKSYSGIIDITSELPETPIKISTNLITPDNSDLLPRLQIHVKSLDADSVYVRCYSQEENRPQTTGFICSKRIIGKCQFDDLPFHEGFVDENGIFNVPCVQYGEHFIEVILYHGGVKTSQFFNFNVDTLSTQTVFVADTRNVATGYNLEELGYTADFSSVRVRDRNNPKGKNALIESVNNTVIATQTNDSILKGSYTNIDATLYNADRTKTSTVTVMQLQGFKKSEYKKYKYIEVGDNLFTLSDLEKYKVFEDDDNVIYDMRYPLTKLEYSTYLTQLDNLVENLVDNQALHNIYFRLSKTSFIKSVPPETSSRSEH